MKTDNTALFEKMPVSKAVITLVIPTIISQIITVIYNMADTFFIGQMNDPNQVAAATLAMPPFVMMTGIANLFGIGGAGAISRALGSKNEKRARGVFAFSLWGGVIVALAYSVIIFVFCDKLISLIGGDEESFAYVKSYLFWTVVIGSLPTMLNALFAHLVRSVGAAKHASVGMALGAGLNIALDPLFMFVLLPKGYEVTGAAVATLISNTVASAYFFIYLAKNRSNPVFTVSVKDVNFGDGIPYDVLSVGLPAALSTTLAMVSNITAHKLMISYGNPAVAGLGVAKKINTLAFNINLGMTQGVLPLIGYNYSAKNYKRMKNVIYFAGGITVFLSVSFLLVMISSWRNAYTLPFSAATSKSGRPSPSISVAHGVALCHPNARRFPFFAILNVSADAKAGFD
jgi:putative MATE family efflux protein